MGSNNISSDKSFTTFERAVRAFRGIKNFENSLVTFVRRSILVKESDGRNLKMANRGNQGKVYKKINAKKCQKVSLGPPELFFDFLKLLGKSMLLTYFRFFRLGFHDF